MVFDVYALMASYVTNEGMNNDEKEPFLEAKS